MLGLPPAFAGVDPTYCCSWGGEEIRLAADAIAAAGEGTAEVGIGLQRVALGVVVGGRAEVAGWDGAPGGGVKIAPGGAAGEAELRLRVVVAAPGGVGIGGHDIVAGGRGAEIAAPTVAATA